MAKSGFFRTVMDAIVDSRSKQAQREVARFVETESYRNLLNEKHSNNSF